MTAPIGLYTQLTHDRKQDYQMMEEGDVDTVVILQPDANKVCKIWEKIKERKGAKVILRVWDWDDGRKYVGDPGVYQFLRDIPVAYGKTIVKKYSDLIRHMREWAIVNGKDFPRNDQIFCHLINEPDTNHYVKEICLFTESAIDEAGRLPEKIYLMCFNFGTGHPALQVDGPGSDPNWQPFWSTIAKIKANGHIVGLHEYYNDLGLLDPSTNPWHVFRHTMDTAREALKGVRVMMVEYGLEMLVNHRMNDHHGWNGVIPAEQFGDTDLYYYVSHVADFVERVIIYANDLPDRTWNSFDSVPAMQYVIPTMLRAWSEYGGDEPAPPLPPTRELLWPCDGQLTQRFGENPEIYKPMGSPAHNGIDIANKEGTIVVSIADGTVEWVGQQSGGYGNYIRIYHPQFDFHSFYAHLQTQDVRGGDIVEAGQPIGRMGNTGNSTGPHLHFEVRFGERYSYWDITSGYGNGRANPEAVYAALGMVW